MTRLERFWRALETIPDLQMIPSGWRTQLGAEVEDVRVFLRPTTRRASVYPCPSPGGNGCPRRIVIHGPGDIVAVCNDTDQHCDRIVLDDEAIVLHEIDMVEVCTQIKKALRLLGRLESMDQGRTWRLGDFQVSPVDQRPAFLHLPRSAKQTEAFILERILVTSGPFLLLTPTRDRVPNTAIDRLRDNGSHLLTLEEFFTFEDRQLLATMRLGDLFAVEKGPAASPPAFAFKKSGANWSVTYRGEERTLHHGKGLLYLQILLRNPERAYSARDLTLEAGESLSLPKSAIHREDHLSLSTSMPEEIIDPRAKQEYKERLRDIAGELETARTNDDLASIERLTSQKEFIEAEVSAAVGLGGRIRTAPNKEQRLRDRVGKAISRSRSMIREHHPTLDRHLATALRRQAHEWTYQPEVDLPWEF